MRMTKTQRRWSMTLGGLAVGVCLLVVGPMAVDAASANLIMDVKVEGQGPGRTVRIQTSKEPTFTVFRLSNPMRVVVDISGGDISRLDSPLQIDDGVVTSIATRQFDANGFLIGRLTVGFESNLAYDVKAEGRAVVIRTAANGATLSQRRVVTPSAPLAENASKRVDELRREVETARRNAEREKEQAKSAQAQAARQLADAERLATQAEARARQAADAQAEAAKLRAEATAAAERDRKALEARAASAERRLSELQRQAQELASAQAEAERAAAEAARSEQEAVAAAARAEALHKEHIAEQQELLAAAKAERAKAESEKEAAKAARIRAIAAKRDADRAKRASEEQRRAAEAASAETDRKLAEIDRREGKARATIAALSEKKAELARQEQSLSRAKEEIAAEKDMLARARAAIAQEKAAIAKTEARLKAERKRVAHAQSKAESRRVAAAETRATRSEADKVEAKKQRRELETLRKELERQQRDLASKDTALSRQQRELASKNNALSKRERSLDAREKEIAVSTRALVKKQKTRTMLASTAVPAIRGTLRGVESRNGSVLLQVEGQAPYELLRVADPPRLVVRLDGVKRDTRRLNYRPKNVPVRRVRLGDHERATHAVLDLASPRVEHSVTTTDEGVLISLSSSKPTNSSTVSVSDVRFDGSRSSARIVVAVDGDVKTEVDDRSRRAWVLKLSGAKVSKGLEKSLDTSSYGSVVRLLSTYQASTEPPVVNIVANLRGAASQTLRRENGKLIWELQGVADAPKVAETVREESNQSTAAFRETASAVSRSVVPTQRRRSRQRVTLDFKDADIINVIRLIADTTGENIIASDEVKGKVTVKLRNVPWERALDVILKSRGYDKVRAGGIIRIATATAIQAERQNEINKQKALEQVEATDIQIVRINYATAADIVGQIQPLLSPRGSVQVDERTNSLVIEDIKSQIQNMVSLTTILDKPTPLVLIEARIVEANSNFEQEFGIQWGGTSSFTRANGNPTGLGFPSDVIVSGAGDDPTVNPTQGITDPGRYAVNLPAPIGANSGGGLGFVFGSAGSDQLLQLRLSALETSGTGRIISSPRITTLDNKTAKIGQGVDIPITVVSAAGANTRLIPANLELEVTPHVTNDGSIVMEIKAEKNEPDFTNTGAFGDPSIVRNFAETEILVADGETAVIGGIYTRSSARRSQKVPLLGDLPLIGWLFRNERETDDRSELLVFITPRIVNRDEALAPLSSEIAPTPG